MNFTISEEGSGGSISLSQFESIFLSYWSFAADPDNPKNISKSSQCVPLRIQNWSQNSLILQ